MRQRLVKTFEPVVRQIFFDSDLGGAVAENLVVKNVAPTSVESAEIVFDLSLKTADFTVESSGLLKMLNDADERSVNLSFRSRSHFNFHDLSLYVSQIRSQSYKMEKISLLFQLSSLIKKFSPCFCVKSALKMPSFS